MATIHSDVPLGQIDARIRQAALVVVGAEVYYRRLVDEGIPQGLPRSDRRACYEEQHHAQARAAAALAVWAAINGMDDLDAALARARIIADDNRWE